MSDIIWDEYEELTPKLQHYGKIFYPRFMDKKRSTLHKAQKSALENVVKWFKNEHPTEDTENFTAMVVMPTGTGYHLLFALRNGNTANRTSSTSESQF